ncbi:hypothetical protein GCM10023187_43390 [Nibrella viscosa]|uniref:TonB-dependent receptor plug domain-containing protein n=1 Tax=Nibrella viscosa TaxID=1084524 RepID=A0ABP8KRC7_9BACT
MNVRFWIPGLLAWLSVSVLLGQTPVTTLSGQISDAKTGLPLPFATVYLNNTSKGTLADSNGVYRLTNVPLGSQELVASVLGYKTGRQALRLTDTSPRRVNLRLEPTDQMLATVTVKARRSKEWLRQFRILSRELLGNRPEARKCRILNPEVLSFREENGHLLATAVEPLVIVNEALGYRLYYNLLHFDYYRYHLLFAGTTRFEELTATNPRQPAQWQAGRMKAYRGSLQHLLANLLTGTHEQAGYQVYQAPLLVTTSTQTLPLVSREARQYIDSQRALTLFSPGELPFERRLGSEQPLEVYYNRVYTSNSPYRDSPYAYSLLILPKGLVGLNTNGCITQGNGLDVRGYLSNDRLATLLPADWNPIEEEGLTPVAITAGRILRADAGLDSLSTLRRRHARRTPPLVYVQTDKALYSTGDQLWLSAYVLDAARQLPIAGRDGTLQVELVAPSGRPVYHQWLPLTDGRVATGFRLSDTLQAGTYRLRAYTALNQPAEGPTFEKTFILFNTIRPSAPSRPINPKPSLPATTVALAADSPDMQFLPEGGRWLMEVPGRLGIKVLQPNGRGLSVSGRIVDQHGNEAARFRTNDLGMGQVVLTPRAGHRYAAVLDEPVGQSTQTVPLPVPEAEGWLLTVDAVSDSSQLTVTIKATGRYSRLPVYVTLQSREQLVYRQKWQLTKGEAQFALSTVALPPGVCRLTLWDSAYQPRAERLVFVPDHTPSVQMRVSTAKPRFDPQEPIAIGLQFRDAEGYPVSGFWSAAVTDAEQVPADTNGSDMRTHLLLTSGLRGHVESPAYYMEPDRLGDLDNLLLTQGWRRLPAPEPADSSSGWLLSGRVLDSRGRPLAGESVMLQFQSKELKVLRSLTTGLQGDFSLNGLLLPDTVQVRAVVPRVKNAVVRFDRPGNRFPAAPLPPPDWEALAPWRALGMLRQATFPALYRDSTARTLAEVIVRAAKPVDKRPIEVERASLHTQADGVLVVEDNGIAMRTATMKELLDMVPGIKSLSRGITSGDNTPLYIVDGIYANYETVDLLDPRMVQRIEILKNAGTAAIYGVRAANGIIAIYTLKGKRTEELTASLGPATTLMGLSTPQTYYTPKYLPAGETAHADRRDVLYWKPLGTMDANGLANLVFPLSDTAKRLRIVVQGLTSEGVPLVFSWELPVR